MPTLISASLCWAAGRFASKLPLDGVVLQKSMKSSKARLVRPYRSSPDRSKSRVVIAWYQPRFSSPIKDVAGSRTSSK